jgi:hypothetical protein
VAVTIADEVFMAITAWKENRGGGRAGMQSVMNVVLNRAAKRGTSPYEECVRPWQFSSLTAKGDPELILWPAVGDPQFAMALEMASEAALGRLPDITGDATSYYAVSIPAPSWAASMTQTAEIQGQLFYK